MESSEPFEVKYLRIHYRVGEQTREDCLNAVKRDGLALRYVIWQTPEICAYAVQQNSEALMYVRDAALQKNLSEGLEPYLQDNELNRNDPDGNGLDGAKHILTPLFTRLVDKMLPIARFYKDYYNRPITFARVQFEFEEGCHRLRYVREHKLDLPLARGSRPWRNGWVVPGDYNYDVVELEQEDEEMIMKIPSLYYFRFLQALWEVLCGYKTLSVFRSINQCVLPAQCIEYLENRFMENQ